MNDVNYYFGAHVAPAAHKCIYGIYMDALPGTSHQHIYEFTTHAKHWPYEI